MRKLLAVSALVAALSSLPFASVQAASGDFDFHTAPVAFDRDGTITLRVRYSCEQYPAPYDASDIAIVTIFGPGTGWYGTWIPVDCDGNGHQLIVTLPAFDGGLVGPATLQFGHQAFSSDSGFISVWVNSPITVKGK